MTVAGQRFYRFNSFVLDAVERELKHNGESVPLTPKAFDTLVVLVANAGHLVTKGELMSAVWPDSFVNEGNVPRTIHTLRRALGEDENGNKYIKTVPTLGYRFVATVGDESGNARKDKRFESEARSLNQRNQTSDAAGRIAGARTARGPRPESRSVLFAAAAVAALAAGFWFVTSDRALPAGPRPVTRSTSSGKAFGLYQEARLLIERHSDGDVDRALELFDRAVELDPNYAAAYAGRADARIWRFWSTASHDDISAARVAADKALELDGSSSYAHAVMCRLKGVYEWDFDSALKECRLAVELDPGDTDAKRELALLLETLGRREESLAIMDEATAIAPTSFNKRSRGLILYYCRRYDEAIEQFRQIEETDPEFGQATRYMVNAYEMKDDWDDALDCYIRSRQGTATAEQIAEIRAIFSSGGWPAILRYMADRPNKSPIQYAGTLAQLGELDKAFAVLNDAADHRRVMIVHAASEPRFDPLRNDPRFDELLKRVGLR